MESTKAATKRQVEAYKRQTIIRRKRENTLEELQKDYPDLSGRTTQIRSREAPMKATILVLSVQFLLSTVGFAAGEDLVGRYSYSVSNVDVSTQVEIVLNPDSTFEYSLVTGASLESGGNSTGRWRLRGSTIILTSDRQWGILDVVERKQATDSVKFVLETEDGEKLGFANVLAEGEEQHVCSSDTDGVAYCKTKRVRSFMVQFVDTKCCYVVEDQTATAFHVTIALKDHNYVYFKSTKWLLKDGGLLDTHGFLLERMRE